MSFEAESNSELTVIVPAYQLHFRFSVQNKIHKQKILSDTRTGILGRIAGPCDFLPARSDEFQKSERQFCFFNLFFFFFFLSIFPFFNIINRIYFGGPRKSDIVINKAHDP